MIADGDFDGGALSLTGSLAKDAVPVHNEGKGTGEIALSEGNITLEA